MLGEMEPPVAGSHAQLAPGSTMGRYELLHRLAVGGMAELYLARQSGIEGFEKIVVLKRVRPHLAEDPEFVRMLMNEARMCAGLDHPNIAQVLDIGEADGNCFFAMEYVHGRNLAEVLQRSGEHPLSLADALTLVVGVAAGLHHAHEQLGSDGRPLGIVHRDVSPSNVMIGYSGAVKLTDFGIARAAARTSTTLAGRLKGKIGYMSPEQCRGDAIDRRSDVFALGIVLYESTTRVRAFHADNDFAVMGRIARGDYEPPNEIDPAYPAVLAAIVARALALDPDERYPTAEAMQVELEHAALELGLRLSTADLAQHMRLVFGTPAHPQSSLHDLGPVQLPETIVALPTSASSSRRSWLLAAGAASVVVTIVTLKLWPESAATATTRAPAQSVERTESVPDVAIDVRDPPREPHAEEPSRATGSEPVESQTDAEVVTRPPRSRARRRTRPTPKRDVDHNAVYPPGFEP
jgi:serine/threonine protein kinase